MVKTILVVLACATATAAAKGTLLDARHFDHDAHVAAAAKKGAAGVACTACHKLGKNNDPAPLPGTMNESHARCYTSGCHGTWTLDCNVRGAKMATGGPLEDTCVVCHKEGRKCGDKITGVAYQPASAGAFESHFAHANKGHTDLTLEKACARCHRAEAKAVEPQPTASGHSLCSACHGATAKPAMSECAACHVVHRAKPAAQHDPFQLANFDHTAHTATAKAGRCYACHNLSTGEKLRPTMLNCQIACHDGVKAFAATGTSCTKCHRAADPPVAARSDLGFSHAEHAKRNVKVDECTSCHAVDVEGQVAPTAKGKDHKTCSANGCHQNEFLARAPKICGSCHDSSSPWVKSVSRVRERPTSEYHENMNHAAHLKALGTANQACDSCHGDKLAGAKRPTGHKACAQCHLKKNNPSMNDCGGCHVRGPAAHAAGASEWSVAHAFKHETHATDKRNGRQTACVECHDKISAARDVASVPTPKMQRCDSCHDGKVAFKSTGFGCARCHARGAAK